ncbi:MAG: hypothetical protein IKP35_00205 [Alphaproteobacteria bacterium]|nr:hypothetical protein [Alphaproteobacteria bacterium]
MSDVLLTKIHEIVDNLKTELRQAHAIDTNNNVINSEIFNRILKQKMTELNALESLVANEMGIVTDKYGSQILFNTITLLNDMIEYQSLTPDDVRAEYHADMQKKHDVPSSTPNPLPFKKGILKLFKNFQRKTPDTSRG